ncbi:Zn(2)-C6 fungal-specific transcription factor [Phycomyces blakesleeanus NRRL 1555(-)]|uniref:Zn(2)-C6 fungal-specific transcription factor n=1 Tax=Phycomyces blakesleeanus (strain ATCC 8743b / DSM 1359 / FGSC 10004 / NBRC 33097 / NRRL 1555) TaxID=763407 RepID=A0A162ZN05_PHYB8|nr:Zn(2)-C6 fungal-specific transcription factor [Phycomyces blakesleeanus NRRL 1555(-)]OAD67961.1 Zn(2)-C6 fungal-specific transcription factor [Phycomyces blakesleeanus NRRL 1555(-)]|eukprot:XP_018286001.1 Zn(2)-C6 fungal-specific transcription factor [Phycomyces blakesleeanus NRRL 1555(-)]
METPFYEQSPESVPETTNKSTGRPKKSSKPQKDKNGANANSKRIKIQRACDACRKRKVKCDGVQPCERCRKADCPCVFGQPPTKRGPPKQYIELLEARLQLVERALRTIDGPARRILDDTMSLQDTSGLFEDTTDVGIVQENGPGRVSVAAPYSPGLSPTMMADRFTINEIGQALYVSDIKERVDRIPSVHTDKAGHSPSHSKYSGPFGDSHSDAGSTADSTASSSAAASPAVTQGSVSSCGHRNQMIEADIVPPEAYVAVQQFLGDIPLALIEAYFDHVHTYAPMIHKPHFYKKLVSKTDCPSKLLLYAMCAVASRWAPASQTSQASQQSPGAPPGFFFYQRAFALIDEHSDVPRVSTVQALILLTKYQEHYRRAGFFCRPGLFLSVASKMANDLGLSRVDTSGQHDAQTIETKKRTFWVIFVYDLMTSIEEGREPFFASTQCTTDYPQATAEEGPTLEELIMNHNSVIQLTKILSDIYMMTRRVATRQQQQANARSAHQVIEEHARLFVLHTHLETFVHELPAPLSYMPTQHSTSYPAEKQQVTDEFIGFLHMMYHFSMILLHRHYVLYPFPEINVPLNAFPHQELCASSASNITNIIETIIDTMPIDIFSYPTRGVQLTIHCAATAATVHQYEKDMAKDIGAAECAKGQYFRTLSTLQRLASESPAVEFHSLLRETELSQLYGQMAVDTSSSSSAGIDSKLASDDINVHVPMPPVQTPSYYPMTQSSAVSIASSSSPSVHYSNDPSSTSPSPVLPSADTSRGRPAKTTKTSRRHTLTGPMGQRVQNNLYALDIGPPQSVVSQAALFTSSASLADPARYASILQNGGLQQMSAFNHHQQPLQTTHHHFQPSLQSQQPPTKQTLRRKQPGFNSHGSHSLEDLRGVRRSHMNRPLSQGGYPLGGPKSRSPSLYRSSSMYFPRTHTNTPFSSDISADFYASLETQNPSGPESRQPSPIFYDNHNNHHSPLTATNMSSVGGHQRRHTISIPGGPGGFDPSIYIDTSPGMTQQQQPFMTPNDTTPMQATQPISKLMTTQNPMMSAPSSDHAHHMLLDTSLPPTIADEDETMNDLSYTEHLTWPMAPFEDIQRSEGHVMQ